MSDPQREGWPVPRPVETAIGILTAAGLTVAGMRRKPVPEVVARAGGRRANGRVYLSGRKAIKAAQVLSAAGWTRHTSRRGREERVYMLPPGKGV